MGTGRYGQGCVPRGEQAHGCQARTRATVFSGDDGLWGPFACPTAGHIRVAGFRSNLTRLDAYVASRIEVERPCLAGCDPREHDGIKVPTSCDHERIFWLK